MMKLSLTVKWSLLFTLLLLAVAPLAGAAAYALAAKATFGLAGARADELALVCGCVVAACLIVRGLSRLGAELRL